MSLNIMQRDLRIKRDQEQTDAQEIYFILRLHVKGLQILKVKNTPETLMEDRFQWMAITGQLTQISYKNIESHLHLSFCLKCSCACELNPEDVFRRILQC